MESLSAVLPITGIMLLISIFLVPMELGTMVMFLFGAVMLILGMGFFQLGAEMAMTPIGEGIGVQISKTKKVISVVLIGFIMGAIITVSEPDLQVLAEQVPSVPNTVLILTVAVGVGIFLALAIIRIKFQISLSKMLIGLYVLLIGASFFVPREFLAVAFDSGGVASGPMTSTFLLPLSIGTCQAIGGNIMTDAFGVVALVALTPLIAIQIMGLVYKFKADKLKKAMLRYPGLTADSDDIIDFEEEATRQPPFGASACDRKRK